MHHRCEWLSCPTRRSETSAQRTDASFCFSLQSKETQGAFTFDRVFDMSCRQADIFDYSIKPTVDDILNGYNGTVFAYGQTGAGKSYTMMGTNIDDMDGKG